MPAAKPHYHAWLVAGTGTAAFMSRPFPTRQAAHQWAERRQPKGFRFVQVCQMNGHCPRAPRRDRTGEERHDG